MNRYKIYPKLNFGVSKLEPKVQTFEEIFDLAKQFRLDKNFSSVYYQLTDMRGCSFDFDVSRISEMVDLINEHMHSDRQKLGVYMVDQPTETAYLQLFFQSMAHKREFCSTIEKAYELLNLQIDFAAFEELIKI